MESPKPSPPKVNPLAAFLNIPYDNRFENIYLAYIAGLCTFGLVPRVTLEIPGGKRRLDRIFELIQTCRYSFHDLSRVQLDRKPPWSTPRFNMPFELGLAVAWSKIQGENGQMWVVFEKVERRITKSLSDLDGTDPRIHDGTVKGVLRELMNILVRKEPQPTIQEMWAVYQDLKRNAPRIMKNKGAKDLFQASVFRELVIVARKYAAISQAALKNQMP
jgi:hypothetical protein